MDLKKYIEYQIKRMMKDTPKELNKQALNLLYTVLERQGFSRKLIGYTIDLVITERLCKLLKETETGGLK